ncbi:MAG: hypothetical protein CMN87_01155 [Stappia sp.]|uniref:AraC family transcriptional regulator n=1 Tax=Stappia sp. TaxID=1870903 RepID=UPI000C3803F2|nr:AraC family transcriptional regulator [Stappia sp.]MAA98124.1 hypothetical protein [Stappia sp.]MBM18592.1 hypothetical protein [Stappia sp.]
MQGDARPVARIPAPTIGGAALPLIAGAMAASGLDAPAAFAAVGLPAHLAFARDAALNSIPLSVFTALLQRAGTQLPAHPALWRCGREIVEPALRGLFPAGATCRSLGELITGVLSDLQQLQAGTSMRLDVEDGLCLVSYRIIDPSIWPRSRDAEFTLGFLHGIVTRCSGSLPPGTVTLAFEHERDSGADLAGESRSEPLHGQPTNLLAFPAALLEEPVPAGLRAPALLHGGQTMKNPEGNGGTSVAGDIVEAVYARLGQGPLDQSTIAADCGLSRRSLRRRLSLAGLSFRGVIEDARLSYALWALRETHLPVAEIAWRLGYDDQGAFARAFRRQAGISPSGARRELPKA